MNSFLAQFSQVLTKKTAITIGTIITVSLSLSVQILFFFPINSNLCISDISVLFLTALFKNKVQIFT